MPNPSRKTVADYARAAWRMLATPQAGSIWDWMVAHARIPGSESGRPGPWLPETGRLFHYWLALATARLAGATIPGDPHAGQAAFILVCAPSQVGKTKSFLHGILAYCIDVLRINVAFITHKQKQIKQHLRIRLLPFFEAVPQLARYLPPTEHLRRERLSGALWQLEGANLHALCGNVASDLREYSHQIGISDEIEAYADDVDGEGDPIGLFLDRQKRYEDTSLFACASTPNRVSGHTWSKLCAGSHERLLVRCTACGHDQVLDYRQLACTRADASPDEIHRHDLAKWACKGCGTLYNTDGKDALVREALAARRWVPGTWACDDEHPGGSWLPATVWRQVDGKHQRVNVGTWIAAGDNPHHQLASWEPPSHAWRTGQFSYLYHPDCSCGRYLAHEMRAETGTAEMQHAHVTGWAAEPWITAGSLLATDEILAACGDTYCLGQCPATTGRWLLCACDQQGNAISSSWFAYEVRLVAPGGETWLVDTGVVHGLAGLTALEERTWLIAGVPTGLHRIGVDNSNGNVMRHLRQWAYDGFQTLLARGLSAEAAKARNRRVLLEGANLAPDTPWSERHAGKRDKVHLPDGVRVFRWNKTHWKDHAAARLQGTADRPPFHVPTDDPETPKALAVWLASLTSEERVVARIGGPGGRKRDALVWQERIYKDPSGREKMRTDTHWWDATCMGEVLADLVGAFAAPTTPPPAAPAPTPTPTAPPPAPPPTVGHRRFTPRRHSRLHHRR